MDKRQSIEFPKHVLTDFVEHINKIEKVNRELVEEVSRLETSFHYLSKELKETKQELQKALKGNSELATQNEKLRENEKEKSSRVSKIVSLFDKIPGKDIIRFEYFRFYVEHLIPAVNNSLQTNQHKVFRNWLLDIVWPHLDEILAVKQAKEFYALNHRGDSILNELLFKNSGLSFCLNGEVCKTGDDWRIALENYLETNNMDFDTLLYNQGLERNTILHKSLLSIYSKKNLMSRSDEKEMFYSIERIFSIANAS